MTNIEQIQPYETGPGDIFERDVVIHRQEIDRLVGVFVDVSIGEGGVESVRVHPQLLWAELKDRGFEIDYTEVLQVQDAYITRRHNEDRDPDLRVWPFVTRDRLEPVARAHFDFSTGKFNAEAFIDELEDRYGNNHDDEQAGLIFEWQTRLELEYDAKNMIAELKRNGVIEDEEAIYE